MRYLNDVPFGRVLVNILNEASTGLSPDLHEKLSCTNGYVFLYPNSVSGCLHLKYYVNGSYRDVIKIYPVQNSNKYIVYRYKLNPDNTEQIFGVNTKDILEMVRTVKKWKEELVNTP